MFQKVELRKTRDFSAKINITFEFIRQNFIMLAKSQLYITGPFVLIGGAFMGVYNQRMLAEGIEPGGIFGKLNVEQLVWLIPAWLFLLLAYVCSITVINEFMRLYEIKEDPRTIEVSEIWDGVKGNFLMMFAAGIAVVVITLIGLVLLLFPGIYVSVALSLLAPIIIIERKSLEEGVSRCFALIKDKWWSTFGLLMVMSLISSFMGVVFQLPQTILIIIITLHKASNAIVEQALWEKASIMLTSIIATMGSSLLQSIVYLAVTFQYYNLVERKEAQGLMNKLESFGQADVNASKNDETY